MRRLTCLLLALLLRSQTLLSQAVTPTQVTPTNDTGVKPFQSYAGVHEDIGLSNGNLSLNIPLLLLPGRNGLDFNLAIRYSSKMWAPHVSIPDASDLVYRWQQETDGGWGFDIPVLYSGTIVTDTTGAMVGRTPSILTLPGGGKTSIEWGATDSQDGTAVRLIRIAANPDGTGSDSAIAYLKDGTQLHFPCEGCSADTMTDTNGNFINISSLSATQTQITDTLGRKITFTQTGNPIQTMTISYKDSNGADQNIVLKYSTLTLFQTAGDATTNQYYTGPTPFTYPQPTHGVVQTYVWVYQPANNSPYTLLTEIDLPGNMVYTFSYNGYGELIQINYPAGGYTKYGYSALLHGEVNWDATWTHATADFREVTSRRVCRDPGGACSPSQEDVTTYVPSTSIGGVNNDSVDVKHFLDEANNIFEKTSYQFTNDPVSDNTPAYYNPRETKRSFYAADGTLLRTVQTSYVENPDLPGYASLPSSVVTTLNDVNPPLVTESDTQYDTYLATVRWPPADGDAVTYTMQTIEARTRFIDNPLTQTEFDYGPNAAGNKLRITNSTWWKSPWDGNHIWNRPLTQEVQDGTSARIAYTTFEYDNYTEGITASGATQLAPCSGSACSSRGNQTAVSHWRNSDGVMLTTRHQFDDAGNIRKVTDPLGHSTTFSFTDNWTDGNSTCAPATSVAAAYPTLVTNQLGHQSTTTYNSCTGTVATQHDPNGQTTTTTYDALNRPLTVAHPDGGFTQYTYVSPTHTTVQSKPATSVTDTSQWPTTETYLDGLGRSSQVAVKNGEAGSGFDVKTTCYDTRGYAIFASYPAQASAVPVASPCSLPGDTLQVDALGRVTQVTHADGSTLLSDYAGRAKRVHDEGRDNSGNRVTRVSQVDGLGRLTSVCEKSSANQMGGNSAPAACGQDIAETGFLTSYQYDIHDPAGMAMQVLQPGLANRYFVYDSLGNLVAATNPESGTTKYAYNDDGTLHTRIRPKANQADPTVLVTTTYTYDVIHRLKQTDYDDNSTASVYMLYDQASASSGQALANSVGRLTSVNTDGGQSVNLYSYDPMGRVASNWQCTPSQNCTASMQQRELTYSYDLLGNELSASNGFGVSFGYGYNIASRLTSMTSSLADAAHPATLFSGATYGPFGLTGATLGNGVNESRGYTSRGLLSSISDNVTITQPAVPGSGSVTISGSERTVGGPPATSANGSVTLSGTIQSTQVVSQPATSGSGSVNIAGSEQNTQAQSSPGTPGHGSASVSGSVLRAYDDTCTCYVDDSGTVTITINGYTSPYIHYYRGVTTAANLAASLAANAWAGVIASSSSGNISMTAASNGVVNYAVSMTQTSDRSDLFPSGSFTLSWTNVTGGTNPTYYTLYDSGTVTATVNGFSKPASYGQGSTPTSIAQALASAFNGDSSSPANATASGASLTLTSKATGAGTNYSLSASSSTGQGSYFSQPSFTANAASSTLLGGQNATYNTLYDSGTVGITVNGATKSVSYGQNSTTATLASALASAWNGDSAAPVNASASGATVSLTTRSTGASTNYALSTTSSTSQGAHFSSPSFSGSASGATLTGGQDAGAPINDTGTISVTVNGFTKSTSYGQASTASSLASVLGGAFTSDASSPVNASVSGGTITLTAKSGGVATNYTLSTSSATTSGSFTGTSFPASASGANLAGGADSTQTPTTPYSVALTLMPNGDVATANDNVNGNWTYGYDDFNRLSSSANSGAAYTYTYDRYGNRWQQNLVSGTGNGSSFSFNGANNRADQFSYDAAGNLRTDALGDTLTYDAENRIVAVGSNVSYVYDGDGRRIRKTVSGVSVDFLYDLADHEVAEMSSSGGWNRGEIFAGGRHIATYANSTTYFNHSDWLGTERSRTTTNGTVCQTTVSLPFGDGTSNPVNNCNPTPDFFTGKERDAETQLDYFGARYYSNGLGRFIVPDPSGGLQPNSDPQTLNLYTYGLNNPMRFIDPDGFSAVDRVKRATDALGLPYGGKGPNSYDCSGLASHSVGTDVPGFPDGAAKQYVFAKNHSDFTTDPGQVQPGDEVFFENKDGAVVHVGVVESVDPKTGAITMVEAAGHKQGVVRKTIVHTKAGSQWGTIEPEWITGYGLWHNFDQGAQTQALNNGNWWSRVLDYWRPLWYVAPAPPAPHPDPEGHVKRHKKKSCPGLKTRDGNCVP